MADAKKEDQDRRSAGDEHQDSVGDEDEHLYEDWDDLASDPEEMSRLGRTLEGLLPDIVKRGVGGLVSEDGLRSLVKDRELPREAVGFLLGQVDATKREVLRIVSKEVRLFLENVDLGGELTKILTSVSFEIKTEVRFIPNDSVLKPNVSNRVRMRGKDGDKKTLSEREPEPEPEPEKDQESAAAKDKTQPEDRQEDSDDSPPERSTGRRRRWRLRRRDEDSDETESVDKDTDAEDQK